MHSGRGVFQRAPSSYQLLGLDFMVTSDLRVSFIEANNYPLWPAGSKRIDYFMNDMGVSTSCIYNRSGLMKLNL